MTYSIVTLKKGEGRSLKRGGLWIYDNEVATIHGRFKNGTVVEVHDYNDHPLALGFINQDSKIRVRVLTRDVKEEINEVFFRKRLLAAWRYRQDVVDTSSCRVVFGEADFLPGLVIDKFEDVLVFQTLSLGMDRIKERLAAIMKDILFQDGIVIRGVYERNDAKERLKEGLERIKGFIGEPFDTEIMINENDVRYYIDVAEGQKTGFFLDQKYNRLALQKIARGKDVLDCFTYVGTFALNCAKGGAKSVQGVDASASAISLASRNAVLNHLENAVCFSCHDVFDYLPTLDAKSYDLVILDPPAFTKSKSSIRNAIKGYRQINRDGLRLVRDGGYLATCTCSHFMDDENFRKAIAQAAASVHKRLRQVEFRQQAPDHPVLWGAGDSAYLKFYIFQVNEERH